MKTMRRVSRTIAVVIGLALIGATSTSNAMVILDIAGGELVGAKNVNVGGTLYDVEFFDGSCEAVFNGCDDPIDDFAFQDANVAQIAAQELLNQVFVDAADIFDSDPSLSKGCPSLSSACFFHIPYFASASVSTFVARNGDDTSISDAVFGGTSIPTGSTFVESPSHADTSAWARFTLVEVPEPSTLALFAVALGGLGFVTRRRRASAQSSLLILGKGTRT